MLIEMRTSMAGARFACIPGDVVDWQPDAEALRLIDQGYAVEVPRNDDTESQPRTSKSKAKK